LLRRPNGDAQELLDARLLEVPHDHALLAQANGQFGGILERMASEDEVGSRGQDVEAQAPQLTDQVLTTTDHLLPAGFEILTVLEGHSGANNGQAIQRK